MIARKTIGPVTGKPFWIVQSVANGRTYTAFGRSWSAAASRLRDRTQGGRRHG